MTSNTVPANTTPCVETVERAVIHFPACSGARIIRIGECRRFDDESVGQSERILIGTMNPGSLFRCTECELAFRNPIASQEQLELLYKNLPAKRIDYSGNAPSAWIETLRLLRHRFATDEFIRVLDIGPFDGGFLGQLPTSWSRLAIEPCSKARKELIAGGVEVIGDFLEAAAHDHAGTCDVVCIFDVFEHFADPTAAVIKALSYLKPGGIMFIATGNVDHWSWRVLGAEHWYLDPVGHIRFGSVRYFKLFSRRYGIPLQSLRTISHQSSRCRQRLIEGTVILYFGLRSAANPLTRAFAALIGRVPGIRQLRHKKYSPYTQQVRDHLLAVFQKPMH